MKTSKYALALGLGLIALLSANTARADSISFDFAGTLQSPVNGTTSITGTFSVDSVTGNLTAYNFVDGNLTYTPANSTSQTSHFGGSAVAVQYFFQTPFCNGVGSTCADLILNFFHAVDFSTLTFQPLLGNSGSGACFATQSGGIGGNCTAVSGHLSAFTSGSATPVAATPEPSSLLMLATGLMGLVGIGLMRRKQLA
jgi:hypothetical protein